MTWIINPYRYVTGGAPPSLALTNNNTYSDNTGLTSHPLNLPTGVNVGDLLLIFATFNGSPAVTDPSGWTPLVSLSSGDVYRIYARIATGSEGSTVSVALSGAQRATSVSYLITGNRNGVTSSEIAVSAVVSANTATPDPPGLTPSWGSAENLWIALTMVQDGGYTFSSYPTNYNLQQQNVQVSTGNGCGVSVAGRLLIASTEDPGVFTTVTSRARQTWTLAVRPQ